MCGKGEGIRENRWEYLSSRENSAIYSHWFGLQREGFPWNSLLCEIYLAFYNHTLSSEVGIS